VQIYDVVHSGASPWIVMEYVPSQSLQEVLQSTGPVGPARAAEIGLAVLAALRAAHRAGVLHRDVKPHNVLIAQDGRVVLTDFGLATFDGDGGMTRPPTPQPDQYWRTEEQRLTAGGSLPGYARITIRPVPLYRGAAEWECRWKNAKGLRAVAGAVSDRMQL
jgi:serine/threonine protein kinase